MLNYLEGFTPADLGITGFKAFRLDSNGNEIQLEVIEHAAYTDKRFAVCAAPTGIGKSLVAIATAKLMGLRTVILTATKGLQTQYLSSGTGIVDIRGRSNFQCEEHKELDCRSGSRMGCKFAKGGCPYNVSKQLAKNSSLVVTSYAMWIALSQRGGLENRDEDGDSENPVEMLICDEAHESPELVANSIAVKIYEKEIENWTDPKQLGESTSEWAKLAKVAIPELKEEIKTTELEILHLSKSGKTIKKEHVDVLHRLEHLVEKLERVGSVSQDQWVIEKREGTRFGRMWTADPIWPGRYAEQYLFCGVPKVVLMSATVRPKTMSLLGVGKEDFAFKEWPSIFPPQRHQILNIPARLDGKEIRIDRRTTHEQLMAWVDHIDSIIDLNLDRKGLIQTVSYARAKFLFDNSRHSELFIGNTADPDSDTAAEVADRFRKSKVPCLLVSPSFATGWDFAMKEAEYGIICKIPFRSSDSKVQKVREAKDPEYGEYMAVIELRQSAGRGMRSSDDRYTVYITDGHCGWFLNKNRHLASERFVNQVRRVVEIPKPQPVL